MIKELNTIYETNVAYTELKNDFSLELLDLAHSIITRIRLNLTQRDKISGS